MNQRYYFILAYNVTNNIFLLLVNFLFTNKYLFLNVIYSNYTTYSYIENKGNLYI